jgi:hypothetical protein
VTHRLGQHRLPQKVTQVAGRPCALGSIDEPKSEPKKSRKIREISKNELNDEPQKIIANRYDSETPQLPHAGIGS